MRRGTPMGELLRRYWHPIGIAGDAARVPRRILALGEFPGDYEAQVSQGPITLHSEEHLATTDRGIALLRRMLRKQVGIVAEGGDPIGASFAADGPPVRFEAGNFLREAVAAGETG